MDFIQVKWDLENLFSYKIHWDFHIVFIILTPYILYIKHILLLLLNPAFYQQTLLLVIFIPLDRSVSIAMSHTHIGQYIPVQNPGATNEKQSKTKTLPTPHKYFFTCLYVIYYKIYLEINLVFKILQIKMKTWMTSIYNSVFQFNDTYIRR